MYFHGNSIRWRKCGGEEQAVLSSAWPGLKAGSNKDARKVLGWNQVRKNLKGKSTKEDDRLGKNQWGRRE